MQNVKRLLIIEDNSDDVALLLHELKKVRLERYVKVIRDGGEALDYLTDELFKCNELVAVFLDLKLPTIDGLTILEAIRANDHLQHLSVVVMTSSNAPEILQKCRELGVAGFVPKPLTYFSFRKAFADTFHSKRNVETTRLTVHAA
jgi:CheY-like chemotaxis protein